MHVIGNFKIGFYYPDKVTIVNKYGNKESSWTKTGCVLIDAKTGAVLSEVVVTRHFKDLLSHRIGRNRALAKALQVANLNKEVRKSIYDELMKIGILNGYNGNKNKV